MLVKVCSKLIHPQEYSFPSKSNPGISYTVVSPTILNDEFCTCPGWQFRGHCSHILDASLTLFCDWHDPDSHTEICPNCGGPTEDFETDSELD